MSLEGSLPCRLTTSVNSTPAHADVLAILDSQGLSFKAVPLGAIPFGLGLEAFHGGPSLDQRAIDGEMLIR
jgi:hypothetical protein